MNSQTDTATLVISTESPISQVEAQNGLAQPSQENQENVVSTPVIATPSNSQTNLPGLSVPRKSVNLQGYHSFKSSSESPFMSRHKSSKSKSQIGNSSIKLNSIDENNMQPKSNARLNRSISPGISTKSQIKNTLNQQTANSDALKPANILSSQKQLKSPVSSTENKGDKLQSKGLSSTLKPLNSTGTQPLGQQLSNAKLPMIPEMSKSLTFQNQRVLGSQVVLVPKVQPQQSMTDSKLQGRKPSTNIASSTGANATGNNSSTATNNGNANAPNDNSNNTQLKFYIGGGNNSERIRKLMAKREGWVETKDATSMFVHFKWQQTTRGYKYEKLVDNNNYKQVVNHFEFHREISNKQYLVKNLMSFSEGIKQNVFDITPLTYVIDFNEENCDLILNNFLKFFEMNMPIELKKKQQNLQNKANDIRKIMRQFQAQYGQQSTEKLYNYFYTRWSLQDTFLDQDSSTYMWLLKPTFLNRGRGIHVFNSLQLLEKLMADYTAGFEEKMLKKQEPKPVEEQSQQQSPPAQNGQDQEEEKQADENSNNNNSSQKENLPIQPSAQSQQSSQPSSTSQSTIPSSTTVSETKKISQNGNTFQIKKIKPLQQGMRGNSTSVLVKSVAPPVKKEKEDPNKYIRSIPAGPCILKASQFVVQKYIEKPLLINNRKFDIRVWALVSHNLDVYFFREGYMRLSSSEFSTDENQLDNLFIHLTNNAIQKYSDSYGTFENGNMWTFDHLWNFLEINYKGADEKQPAKYYKKKIVDKIRDIILITFCSVKKKLNQNDRKHCFEMFGFDFLIDADLHTWLIEVNTNPAIEECSAVTQALIPRALDDAFKLTIDQIFPRKQQQQQQQQPQGAPKSKEEQIGNKNEGEGIKSENNMDKSIPAVESPQAQEQPQETYPIRGYEDNFNMWELLGNLRDSSNMDVKKKYKQTK